MEMRSEWRERDSNRGTTGVNPNGDLTHQGWVLVSPGPLSGCVDVGTGGCPLQHVLGLRDTDKGWFTTDIPESGVHTPWQGEREEPGWCLP